jgi:S1-C subfamily serine protease
MRTIARTAVAACLSLFGLAGAALAQPEKSAADQAQAEAEGQARAKELIDAIVYVKARAVADARTNEILGRERAGSGIVIDERGHVLTIGYLVIEAQSVAITTAGGRTVPAGVAGYDHATGFAVLKPIVPLGVKPLPLGASTALREQDVVMTLPFGGTDAAQLARVVSKRQFTGSWEYLLDEALFTSPPNAAWAGAALINREFQLVGVGSLLVRDAVGDGQVTPGNMFVPIDILKPILSDLIAHGKRAEPQRPWLGLGTEALQGRLVVTRVSPDGPAAQAGLQHGDVVLGVGDATVATQAELYRKVWSLGAAGVDVPLRVMRGATVRDVTVKSIERTAYFRSPVTQ